MLEQFCMFGLNFLPCMMHSMSHFLSLKSHYQNFLLCSPKTLHEFHFEDMIFRNNGQIFTAIRLYTSKVLSAKLPTRERIIANSSPSEFRPPSREMKIRRILTSPSPWHWCRDVTWLWTKLSHWADNGCVQSWTTLQEYIVQNHQTRLSEGIANDLVIVTFHGHLLYVKKIQI
jgi:hypothetical protein